MPLPQISRKSIIDSIMKVFFLLLYAVPVISYYIFCDSYPFTCTMNIRYVVMSIFTGAFFLSAMLHMLISKGSAYEENTAKSKTFILNNTLIYGTAAVIILFSAFSAVTYIMIGYVPPIYDGVVLV